MDSSPSQHERCGFAERARGTVPGTLSVQLSRGDSVTGSRQDAEDVLQTVFSSCFDAGSRRISAETRRVPLSGRRQSLAQHRPHAEAAAMG